MKFFIVDAFSREIFGGNPAGVVVLGGEEDFPSEEIMVKTAGELRYSETAFVKKLGDGEYKLRYFTPNSEVELCGHATIASFYSLYKMGEVEPGKIYRAETLAGKINIEVLESGILMDMASPEEFGSIDKLEKLEELYGIMGIEYREMEILPKLVSTGLKDIILPVENEGELEKVAPDFEKLTELSREYEVVGVHAFTLNSLDGKIHARNFAPLYDIDEEAATGTSNGALVYYLYQYGLIEENKIYEIIQGEKMKRPSSIMGKLTKNGEKLKIQVGGDAVILASGEIYL